MSNFKKDKMNNHRTYILAGNPYDDRIDVHSDAVIIYGHLNYQQRAKQWKNRQYSTLFMTGLTSGSYDDYLSGKFDGEKHYNERQQNADGTRWERNPSLYQLTPTKAFIEYLKSILKTAIDHGAEAIILAEPEYAVETGYSSAFKEAWRSFYEQPWQDPWSSVQNRYMSGHLKLNLFLYTIDKLFSYAKKYAESRRQPIDCIVAIQSLISYTHWGIVSPHSQLLDLPHCDGILAMVSTNTARTPNIFQGLRKERTFETALLEYGAFVNLIKGADTKLIFMHDPMEDYLEHTWEDYKQNYEATVTASLMYPDVFRYLTTPWPKRIFTGQYSREGGRLDKRKPIPAEYATEILVMNNTLQNLRQQKVTWDVNCSNIGILISDSMLLQRGGPSSSDQDLSFFYGLALPLLKCGILPQPLPLEHSAFPGFLDNIQILIMSYIAMKPMRPDYHAILAEWVKAGNIIIYVDDFKDPYNKVMDWWNSGMHQYSSPAEHLFELLGLGRNPDFDDVYFVGRGRVILRQANPADFAQSVEKQDEFMELIKHSTHFLGRGWTRFRPQNYIRLRRGAYLIAAVFDEAKSLKPLRLRGRLINLFDPELTYSRKFILQPGEQGFFINLSWLNRRVAGIIASASSIRQLSRKKGLFAFTSIGPTNTQCITKVLIPKKPKSIQVQKANQPYPCKINYERFRKVLTLQYENDVDGIKIAIRYPVPQYRVSWQRIKNRLSFSKKKDKNEFES